MLGHPRWAGHGGEFWQNVVHWRRECQTTSVFLPREPHEQFEKAKKDVCMYSEIYIYVCMYVYIYIYIYIYEIFEK